MVEDVLLGALHAVPDEPGVLGLVITHWRTVAHLGSKNGAFQKQEWRL